MEAPPISGSPLVLVGLILVGLFLVVLFALILIVGLVGERAPLGRLLHVALDAVAVIKAVGERLHRADVAVLGRARKVLRGLTRVLGDATLREGLGRRALGASRRYDVRACVDQMQDFYDDLLSGGRD